MLATKSPLVAATSVHGRDVAVHLDSPAEVGSPPAAPAPNARSLARYLWALLPARPFGSLPLVCTNSGANRRVIGFVTAPASIERILNQIVEPPRPPSSTHTRGPPAWDDVREPIPIGTHMERDKSVANGVLCRNVPHDRC